MKIRIPYNDRWSFTVSFLLQVLRWIIDYKFYSALLQLQRYSLQNVIMLKNTICHIRNWLELEWNGMPVLCSVQIWRRDPEQSTDWMLLSLSPHFNNLLHSTTQQWMMNWFVLQKHYIVLEICYRRDIVIVIYMKWPRVWLASGQRYTRPSQQLLIVLLKQW